MTWDFGWETARTPDATATYERIAIRLAVKALRAGVSPALVADRLEDAHKQRNLQSACHTLAADLETVSPA